MSDAVQMTEIWIFGRNNDVYLAQKRNCLTNLKCPLCTFNSESIFMFSQFKIKIIYHVL